MARLLCQVGKIVLLFSLKSCTLMDMPSSSGGQGHWSGGNPQAVGNAKYLAKHYTLTFTAAGHVQSCDGILKDNRLAYPSVQI